MDFWSRLIGGAGYNARQTVSQKPQHRLARFERNYKQILHTWQKTPRLAEDLGALDTLSACFQRLTSILHDESRSPAPHPCLSFASTSAIFIPVSRIASTAYNERIIREAVGVFAALIDSEEEAFLADAKFAEALMTFIDKSAGSNRVVITVDTEGEIVELLFGIAAKIRLQPEILPVWFTSRTKGESGDSSASQKSNFVGIAQKDDFPLCYQLVNRVHHEGRIGDFARTGLLYIFESASKSEELEVWLVESDLPTLMASGLGALYSQMSRKLSIRHPEKDMPMILALSDYSVTQPDVNVESSFSAAFQVHMNTFLSYLTFWQDVLEHCKSVDVTQTLIDHFQVLFLQQILYPSLLESSDVDGGSSVAVLTYLRHILNSLERPELVNMILQYLLALPDPAEFSRSRPRSPLTMRRRSSLMLLTRSQDEDDRANPSVFNMADLIHSSVRSSDAQTVVAALKLLTVLLSRNHDFAVNTILQVVPVTPKESRRTVGGLNAEMDCYLALAVAIGGESGLDEAYESHLKDALRSAESHRCSEAGRAVEDANTDGVQSSLISSGSRSTIPHYLNRHGSFLRLLFSTFEKFFTNDIEINLSLSEVLVTLASCPHVHLEGWLAVERSKYKHSSSSQLAQLSNGTPNASTPEPDGLDLPDEVQLANLLAATSRPTWLPQHNPMILSILYDLQAKLSKLQDQIPTFNALINSRKAAFRTHEVLAAAAELSQYVASPARLSADASRAPTPSDGFSTPARNTVPESLPRRLFGDSLRDSRSSSPLRNKHVSVPSPGTSSPTRGRSGQLSPGSDAGTKLYDGLAGTLEDQDAADNEDESISMDAEMLSRKVKFSHDGKVELAEVATRDESTRDDKESEHSQAGGGIAPGFRVVSLNHVLTNAIILQEFVLELVALMQVRASLFAEVQFA